MSMCDRCIHSEVCGLENNHEEALIYCGDFLCWSWIPVSERLPYLDNYTDLKVWQQKVLITGYLSFDNTKKLFVSEAFAKDVIFNRVPDTVVTAWMPLPKPYEPQERSEEE